MALKYNIATDLDDPATTLTHREIILSKPFLKQIYLDWYAELNAHSPAPGLGIVLEIGSGGGFIKDVIPSVKTSDILPLGICDYTFSAEDIPFGSAELGGIFMVNVFHHIPKPHLFLREAERVLRPGGKIVMIEPANTLMSRFIYKRFHHEPFDEHGGWEIQSTGPLSGSNQALPYIYFTRDKEKFQSSFKSLRVVRKRNHSPFTYILSGGVSRKAMIPFGAYRLIKGMEGLLSPFAGIFGMFQTIVIEKQ